MKIMKLKDDRIFFLTDSEAAICIKNKGNNVGTEFSRLGSFFDNHFILSIETPAGMLPGEDVYEIEDGFRIFRDDQQLMWDKYDNAFIKRNFGEYTKPSDEFLATLKKFDNNKSLILR